MTDSNTAAQIAIHVDDQLFYLDAVTMSGGQLKALVDKDIQYQLFLEGPGIQADRPIADNDSVRLESGMRFYTVPPAVFGS